jgi:hypothetical protein
MDVTIEGLAGFALSVKSHTLCNDSRHERNAPGHRSSTRTHLDDGGTKPHEEEQDEGRKREQGGHSGDDPMCARLPRSSVVVMVVVVVVAVLATLILAVSARAPSEAEYHYE